MDTNALSLVPKSQIPSRIKLPFKNNSNLKTDIQNRITPNIEADFSNALKNMKGDSKTGEGIPFSEITLLAMAYFYSNIFKDKIKDDYYTLEKVKGFLDANNLTRYTAIYEIDVTFYKLNDAPLFRHCWLIIQSSWFFNSIHFGHHQYIDYINHFINTGEKLPIENYKYDKAYLEKKYNDIRQSIKKNIPINGFTLVGQWYYGILFMVCNELTLPTTHFNVLNKDNRQYNPLTKTSRHLRSLTPFRLNECDIKSAFPTFLDALTGAKLKDHVYNNLMKSEGISRSQAKVLFNKICNSSEYKSRDFTADFFLKCGYSTKNIEDLLFFTHNDHLKFFQFMTRREDMAIQIFVQQNNLQRGTRLHDALLFIDDKIKPPILKVGTNCDFGYTELNRPVIKESFINSNKRLPYAYIKSIPNGLNLISKHEGSKSQVKGFANGFIFYLEKYEYLSAGFNLNNNEIDHFTFLNKCKVMFSTLQFLNKKSTSPKNIYLILKHIRENSNFIFNVRAMYSRVLKYNSNPIPIEIKKRDYSFTDNLNFKTTVHFLNELNKARGIVNNNYNLTELFCLIQERIENNDYSYINELNFIGLRKNNALFFAIIKRFNMLCSGFNRSKRNGVKNEALYNDNIKSLTLKSISLNKQLQNAFLQKGIKKYEQELKKYNRLINNRPIANQLFLIICEVCGYETYLSIIKNPEVQNLLKVELISMIDKIGSTDAKTSVLDFNKRFIKNHKANKPNPDEDAIFAGDYSNSIFNQVSFDEARKRGEQFLKEFLKFHNIEQVNTPKEPAKVVYKLPELDFDS